MCSDGSGSAVGEDSISLKGFTIFIEIHFRTVFTFVSAHI